MRFCYLILCCLYLPCAYAETLVVAQEDADNRPFEYLDAANRLTGFHVELVRAVTALLGWQVTFERQPWKRVIANLESGKVDAVTYIAKNAEREKFAYFLTANLLHVNGATLYIKKSRSAEIRYNMPLEAFVRHWKTGFPAGYYMGERISKLLDSDAPIEKPTVNQLTLFKMLLHGRYDVVFGSVSALELSDPEAVNIKNQLQQLDNARFIDTKMYIAFAHKQGLPKAEAFAEAYRHFRLSPAYMELAEKFHVVQVLPTAEDFQ